ncbi:MAG TPA: hypothetical protein VGB59_12280 [Allosphingosinicella sp.]|jgi:hypothetical protein
MIALLIPALVAGFVTSVPIPSKQRPGGIAYEPPSAPSPRSQTEKVRDRIEIGRETGQLSRREARALRREARQIGRLSDRYAHGGLSASERRELQARIDYLNGRVSAKRSEGASRR